MSSENKRESADENIGTFTYKLKKTINYNGTEYTELTFEFDKLTGADALNIEDELSSIGKPAVVPAFSGEYLTRMAAKACTEPIGADIFYAMNIVDFEKIKSKARSFFLRSE